MLPLSPRLTRIASAVALTAALATIQTALASITTQSQTTGN